MTRIAWTLAALLVAMSCATAVAHDAADESGIAAMRARLDEQARRLRDWPDLARYRDENAALPAPAAGVARVVFMGDSITDGWGREAGEFFPGKAYVNRGISGQTTPQMLLRFRADVLALSPRAVVVLAGTNDIAGNTGPATDEEIAGSLASMAELARAHGIAVVLATLLPVSNDHDPQIAHRPPARIVALNDRIRRYCRDTGCTLLDYHAAMVDDRGLLRRGLSDDGLHPNAAGYAVMQPLAEAAIAKALAAAPAASRERR